MLISNSFMTSYTYSIDKLKPFPNSFILPSPQIQVIRQVHWIRGRRRFYSYDIWGNTELGRFTAPVDCQRPKPPQILSKFEICQWWALEHRMIVIIANFTDFTGDHHIDHQWLFWSVPTPFFDRSSGSLLNDRFSSFMITALLLTLRQVFPSYMCCHNKL